MKASDYLIDALNEYVKHGIGLSEAWNNHISLDVDIEIEKINAMWIALHQLSGNYMALCDYERSCSRGECLELLELAIDIAHMQENTP